MRKFLLFVFILALNGCISSASYELGPEWKPLKEIRERPYILHNVGPNSAITTVGRTCYVRDLEDWLSRVPPESAHFKAVMRHEQEHSKRELAYGVPAWLAHYELDTEFALHEEQIGFYYEITERMRLHDFFVPDAYAVILSSYKVAAGSLISLEDAKQWVYSVMDGSWEPPTE